MAVRNTSLSIPTPRGVRLSGVLVEPEGPPRGKACIAHCFACSKDFPATVRLARALAEEGYATLRFDFAGLGESEGAFAESTLQTGREDLEAALDTLAAHHPDTEPTLLLGHSFGGALAILVAPERPEVDAVVTIAAPSQPGHVRHLFQDHAEEIAREGHARLIIGGRPVTIGRALLESIEEPTLETALAQLNRPILLLHAPGDTVVNVDHAGHIFRMAQHPRSFVALNRVDHLLSRPEHTRYVAGLIRAWSANLTD